jgi:hypothetical protein
MPPPGDARIRRCHADPRGPRQDLVAIFRKQKLCILVVGHHFLDEIDKRSVIFLRHLEVANTIVEADTFWWKVSSDLRHLDLQHALRHGEILLRKQQFRLLIVPRYLFNKVDESGVIFLRHLEVVDKIFDGHPLR